MAQKHNYKFYSDAIVEHGISPKGVRWSSQDAQYKRFFILTDFIKDKISSSTITDAGCGFGDYYYYLLVNDIYPLEYTGIDCLEDMIDISKARFPDIKFLKRNILEEELVESDYYVCSGALNILTKEEVFIFIKNCFSACKKGFVFNFLKLQSYNKIEISEVIEFCNSLSDTVETKDNYLNNDFTIFMVK